MFIHVCLDKYEDNASCDVQVDGGRGPATARVASSRRNFERVEDAASFLVCRSEEIISAQNGRNHLSLVQGDIRSAQSEQAYTVK